MQFPTLLLAAASFTGLASAAQFTNTVFNNLTAGEPFTFTWSNATGAVSINLKNGPPLQLVTVQSVTSGQTGGSYTWDVPANLPADTYAFEIIDSSGVPNYSVQVQLIGGASASASVTATVSSNSTTTLTTSATTTGGSNVTATRSTTRTTGASTTRSGIGATTTPTTAPDAGGMAAGFTSNLAFVFLAAGALMFLN